MADDDITLRNYAYRSGVLEAKLGRAREALQASLPLLTRSRAFGARRAAEEVKGALASIDRTLADITKIDAMMRAEREARRPTVMEAAHG